MAIYFRTPNGNVRQASTIHMNVGNNVGEKRIQSIYYGVGAGKVRQIYEGVAAIALLNSSYQNINNISFGQKEIPDDATLVISHPNSKYKIYAGGNTRGINNNGFGSLLYAKLYTKAKKIEIVNPENLKVFKWIGFNNSNLSYSIENIIFNGCTLPNTVIFLNIKELYGNADKFQCHIIGRNNAQINLGTINNAPNLYGNLRLKAQNIANFYGILLNSNNVNFFAELETCNQKFNLRAPVVCVNKYDINLTFNNNYSHYIWLVSGSCQNFTLTLNWNTQDFLLNYIDTIPLAWISVYNNFKLIGDEAKIYLNCKKMSDFTYLDDRKYFLGPFIPTSADTSGDYYSYSGSFHSNFYNKIYIYCNNFSIANKIMQKTLRGLHVIINIKSNYTETDYRYTESFSPITNAEIYRPDDINKTQPYFGNGDYGAYRSNTVGICVFYDYLE